MERILIKRTITNLEQKETLSFYRLEFSTFEKCFEKFFEDKEKLKYNQHDKVEIVDKQVREEYLKWENKHIYKK
jgi:hypothetical protein